MLRKGDLLLPCATPPTGEQGDPSDMFYSRNGTLIQVSPCTVLLDQGMGCVWSLAT